MLQQRGVTALLLLVCGYGTVQGYRGFGGYSRYGGLVKYPGYGFRSFKSPTANTRGLSGPAAEIWTSTGTVPDKLERVPDQLLQIQFGGLNVAPNQTVLISQMQRRPRLYWDADPEALYTLMIEDEDVLEVVSGGTYVTGKHWLVTNIPGTNVAAGDEVWDYLQSFSFASEDGGLDDQNTRDQRHIIMVYKQTRRIAAGEVNEIKGCSETLLGRLSPDHQTIFKDLDLEGPVAANFYRVGYQDGWSEFFICYVKKCTGFGLIPDDKIPPNNKNLRCLT